MTIELKHQRAIDVSMIVIKERENNHADDWIRSELDRCGYQVGEIARGFEMAEVVRNPSLEISRLKITEVSEKRKSALKRLAKR